jgi:CubicO group peptidase (beta-lactamase class C family)
MSSIKKILRDYQEIRHYSHAHVLAFQGDTILVDDFIGSDAPVCFDLASLTKVLITSHYLIQLLQKGALSLETKVSDILPSNFSATIDELWQHKSGAIPWYPFYLFEQELRFALREFLLQRYPQALGVRNYSDVGFMLLGEIVTSTFGMSLDALLKNDLAFELNYGVCPHQFVAPTSTGNPFEEGLAKRTLEKYPSSFKAKKFTHRSYQVLGECNDLNAYSLNGVSGHAGLFGTAMGVYSRIIAMLKIWDESNPAVEELVHGKVSRGFVTEENIFQAHLPTGWIGHHGFTGVSLLFHPLEKKGLVFLTNRQCYGLNAEGNYPNWKEQLNLLMKIIFKTGV